MKFSEKWLREWVNPQIDSYTLAEQMTMAGLEVESIEPVSGKFSGVMIGRIIECFVHPYANTLQITKVDIGSERLLDIVCRAKNCRSDMKVVVGMMGESLKEDVEIKDTQGILSEGILCSFYELGMSEKKSSSIIELPSDAPIGQDIREYLNLDDHIININVTPNRADCLSILGIARDIAVLNNLVLQYPKYGSVEPIISDTVPVLVENTDYCPRYLTRIIKNIDIHTYTPIQMQEKLRRCGIPSVNIVVDVMNYISMELGQPMQALDLNKISGGIIVRQSKPNETLTLLDDHTVNLSPGTLVIADEKEVIAIAGGIVEGKHASISMETKNIILGCAFFHPSFISIQARNYGRWCNSSSQRYERGVDPSIQSYAILRATEILVSICRSSQPGPLIECTVEWPQSSIIRLRREKLNRIIGYEISDAIVCRILTNLGFKVTHTEHEWEISSPSWRFDISIEEDLIEEIARIYGYNSIPSVPVYSPLNIPYHRERQLSLSRVKMLLVDRGYHEVITYSFVNPNMQKMIHPDQEALLLSNPMSLDMSAMRLSLWTGLINTVIYNQHRQQKRIRLFESGLRFIPDQSVYLGVQQEHMLSGIAVGSRFDEHWDLDRYQLVDFYDVKGDIEAVLELTGKGEDVEFRSFNTKLPLHPGQSAEIFLKGECIGLIGVIHPALEMQLNIKSRTVVFEIFLEKLTEGKLPKFSEFSRFPYNYRDISLIVADSIAAADILMECRRILKTKLVGIYLFDVYQSKDITKGFKSLSIRLILQDLCRTLEEEEIDMDIAKCVVRLRHRFQADVRDGLA